MIQLKDVSYVRLGSPDLESAENFATACLGLQIAERGKKDLYLRSDARAHTLCYSEGDPNDQTVGFEVEDDGQGLAAEQASTRTRRGLGLTAMRTRADDMGGTIAWEGIDEGGTRVIVRFRTGAG
jgi:2,3-dihydroxy-p-cumate/2,3-dihydroxybenzoate 3,4-dioxygenase